MISIIIITIINRLSRLWQTDSKVKPRILKLIENLSRSTGGVKKSSLPVMYFLLNNLKIFAYNLKVEVGYKRQY